MAKKAVSKTGIELELPSIEGKAPEKWKLLVYYTYEECDFPDINDVDIDDIKLLSVSIMSIMDESIIEKCRELVYDEIITKKN